jgi:hypothetical protein
MDGRASVANNRDTEESQLGRNARIEMQELFTEIDFVADLRQRERTRAVGETYLDWLFGAESAVCEHEWVVESSIGPDSGSEDFYCSKCGACDHVIWY